MPDFYSTQGKRANQVARIALEKLLGQYIGTLFAKWNADLKNYYYFVAAICKMTSAKVTQAADTGLVHHKYSAHEEVLELRESQKQLTLFFCELEVPRIKQKMLSQATIYCIGIRLLLTYNTCSGSIFILAFHGCLYMSVFVMHWTRSSEVTKARLFDTFELGAKMAVMPLENGGIGLQ